MLGSRAVFPQSETQPHQLVLSVEITIGMFPFCPKATRDQKLTTEMVTSLYEIDTAVQIVVRQVTEIL